jgi:hypothetical protein
MKDQSIIFRVDEKLKNDLTELSSKIKPTTTLSSLMEYLGREYRDKNKHLLSGNKKSK